MKIKMKVLATALVVIFASSILLSNITYANESINVTIEGELVNFAGQRPVIVDGRTLVPVRGVFEQLGFDVSWDGSTRQATLTSDDYIVILTISSDVFTTNGEEHILDVPAQIIGESTMLPIRAVLESVRYHVNWSAEEQTVIITPAVIIQGELFPTSGRELDLTLMLLTNDDIKPLEYMIYLESLRLDDNQISDLSSLSNLTNLRDLSLSNNQISDLAPLANLKNLESLELFGNEVSNITPLSELTYLNFLGLGSNQISDLKPFAETLTALPSLAKISLSWNQISDITHLSGLENLTELWLHENEIYDITPLADLTNLTALRIPWNDISDLAPIAGLVNLTTLQLTDNRISYLSPLSRLTNLTMLELNSNLISDLTPLSGLPNLTELSLWGNLVTNWEPVAHIDNVSGRP
ncbi:MAG: leucine-rich repeat domain-containing protein [Defluviitaleaceae bacterium]|nr:leucine-rich repeat domain-containing protein [Defluviitaleaceae bacterium]